MNLKRTLYNIEVAGDQLLHDIINGTRPFWSWTAITVLAGGVVYLVVSATNTIARILNG